MPRDEQALIDVRAAAGDRTARSYGSEGGSNRPDLGGRAALYPTPGHESRGDVDQ